MLWKLLIVFIAFLITGTLAGYGDEVNGFPVWQERANLHLINVVRISPQQYVSLYGTDFSPSLQTATVLQPATYPAVAPLYYVDTLNQASRSHSVDMATTPCFQHNSCNGQDVFARIGSFYTCSGSQGENIAAGFDDPRVTQNQWLCDATSGSCAADGSGNDGHRSNIMGSGYKGVGSGYSPKLNGPFNGYWTQDFGGSSCLTTSPLVASGSHIFLNSKTRFSAVYFKTTTVTLTVKSVVISGVAFPLNLEVGAEGKGSYFFEDSGSSACREYYFYFKDSNGIETFYPETGSLMTFKEGSCAQSFKAGRGALPGNIDTINTVGANGGAANAGAIAAGVLVPLIVIGLVVAGVLVYYFKFRKHGKTLFNSNPKPSTTATSSAPIQVVTHTTPSTATPSNSAPRALPPAKPALNPVKTASKPLPPSPPSSKPVVPPSKSTVNNRPVPPVPKRN